MTTTDENVAALRACSPDLRRDLIDACIAAVVRNVGHSPEYAGRLVQLAAMIGEPAGPSERNAIVREIADWLESGRATGLTGNGILADRIRTKFLTPE